MIKVIVVLLAALYTVWPLDVIPDVPVVGWIDDGVIDAIALLYCIKGGKQ